MSTWHQERTGRKSPVLYHSTKWSSYNSTGHLSVMRHADEKSCMEYCKNTGDIPLAPQNKNMVVRDGYTRVRGEA